MRYYYNRKARADESCRLRISELRKDGMLRSGQTISKRSWTSSMARRTTTAILLVDVTDVPFAILIYSVTDRYGNKTDCKDEILLVTTPCNFGGVRYWFECPSCCRRMGVLYLAPGDVHFRCRHCNDLSYHSRNRCLPGQFGHTSRQIDELSNQIKRWTWRGRPTRKVRRLQALRRKMGVLSGPMMTRMDKFSARLRR